MGLDMYLYAEQYVSGYDFNPDAETEKYRDLVSAFNAEDVVDDSTPSAYVKFTVGYWRKANAIHKWFVEHCQDGVDDCRDAWVGREQLAELKETSEAVLKSLKMKDGKVYAGSTIHPDGRVEERYIDGKVATFTEVAQDLLPTGDGFFFGGTDYDDWYATYLQDTINIVEKALKLSDDWTFEYHSSW